MLAVFHTLVKGSSQASVFLEPDYVECAILSNNRIEFRGERSVADQYKVICGHSLMENALNALLQIFRFFFAIGVSTDGYREIIGAAEGMKEDFESWHNFFIWLKERGLTGVRLIVGDKCLGMLESIADVFPEAKYQRCTVHFYRNVFSVVPRGRMREVSLMLKAIHAQENKEAAREKAASVVAKLREMKLSAAAKKVEDGVDETLTYMDFPTEHWTRIRTNNVTERVNREIKRRTKAIGAFPDGQSALMLVCARLRYVAASDWGTKRYLNMDHLFQMELMNNTETAEASAG